MSVTLSYARCLRSALVLALASERGTAQLLGFDGFEPTAPETLDIGKDWDVLWYLLSAERQANPDLDRPTEHFGKVILGAEPLPSPLDLGYGPQHIVPEPLVLDYYALLRTVPESNLRSLFSPVAMNRAKVYPGSWQQRAGALESILANLRELRAFYGRAAQAGHVVAVALS